MYDEDLNSLLRATFEALHRHDYDGAFRTITDRVRDFRLSGTEQPRALYLAVYSSLPQVTDAGIPDAPLYRLHCRFLGWFAAALFASVNEANADCLHELGLLAFTNHHAPLAKSVFCNEWKLRKKIPSDQSKFAELFIQLALMSDELGKRRSATRLLKAACRISDIAAVLPRNADAAYRLFAACSAIQGDIKTAIHYLEKAELLCSQVYPVTPIQAHLGWTKAICLAWINRATLLKLSGIALESIFQEQEPQEYFEELQFFPAMLNRTPLNHLAALSTRATLRLIEEGYVTVSPANVALEKNNLGNALLAARLDRDAREIFLATVQFLSGGKAGPSDDPDSAYQLAHACAGIGYSHYNEARARQQPLKISRWNLIWRRWRSCLSLFNSFGLRMGPELSSLREADKWFSKAIAALAHSKYDKWIDSRIWAYAGLTCARLGLPSKMHKMFARALLAGNGGWRASTNSLAEFFNPDEKTRMAYSQGLFESGYFWAAVILSKAAVHSVHQSASPGDSNGAPVNRDIDKSLARQYVWSRSTVYDTLNEQLVELGRHNEAEQAYQLLMQHRYYAYLNRDLSLIDVEALAALTAAEKTALRRSGVFAFLESMERNGSLSSNEAAPKLARAFSKLDSVAKDCVRVHRKIASGGDAVQLKNITERLGSRNALLRYLVTEHGIRIIALFRGQRITEHVKVRNENVSAVVHALRQCCRNLRDPAYSSMLVRAAKAVYKLLIAPIYHLLKGRCENLFIEADHLLAGVPFSILHNGGQFLVEEFSLALFHPIRSIRHNPLFAQSSSGKKVAIFLCSDLPGAELPGAAREGEAIMAGLKRASAAFESVNCHNSSCTIEAFLAAIGSEDAKPNVIHLATHAAFNPTSESLSYLAFSNGGLSIRRLREQLENQKSQIDLFVLSACGTARQDLEVDGFSITLLNSGVRSVVASLWENVDWSAPEFFQLFYEYASDLTSTENIAQAIRSAQLGCLRDSRSFDDVPLSHPGHWGTYVLSCGQF